MNTMANQCCLKTRSKMGSFKILVSKFSIVTTLGTSRFLSCLLEDGVHLLVLVPVKLIVELWVML